ncbi:hypothetical protein D3C78_1043910 [compost metagenome]
MPTARPSAPTTWRSIRSTRLRPRAPTFLSATPPTTIACTCSMTTCARCPTAPWVNSVSPVSGSAAATARTPARPSVYSCPTPSPCSRVSACTRPATWRGGARTMAPWNTWAGSTSRSRSTAFALSWVKSRHRSASSRGFAKPQCWWLSMRWASNWWRSSPWSQRRVPTTVGWTPCAASSSAACRST